jgi:hypothetical protein
MELVSLGMYKDKSKGYVFVMAQKYANPDGKTGWQLFKVPNINIPFMDELKKQMQDAQAAAMAAGPIHEATVVAPKDEAQVTNSEPVNEETPIQNTPA